MLNIIKADIYRILRGKGVYITFGLLLAMVALIVFTSASVTVGVNMEELEEALGHDRAAPVIYNGQNIAKILYGNMDAMAYFLLPLLIFVAAPMFSHGAVKNGLSYGMSRTKLYLSKLILACLFCVLMVLVYMLSGMLLATILRGFGGTVAKGWWMDLFKVCGSQTFMLLAMTCIGVFLVFVTKRTAMVNGIYIAFTMVPLLIINLLFYLNEKFVELYHFDVIGNIKSFTFINSMPHADIAKGFMVGAGYMVITTILGILIFNKSEIR